MNSNTKTTPFTALVTYITFSILLFIIYCAILKNSINHCYADIYSVHGVFLFFYLYIISILINYKYNFELFGNILLKG